MTPLSLGQALKGKRTGLYTITKQLHDCISLRHYDFRSQNERDILLRFQNQTPFIRPLIDEVLLPVDGSPTPPAHHITVSGR